MGSAEDDDEHDDDAGGGAVVEARSMRSVKSVKRPKIKHSITAFQERASSSSDKGLKPREVSQDSRAFGIRPFTDVFDKHFQISSERIWAVLPESGVRQERVAELVKQPHCWGIQARFVNLLYDYIAADMTGYAACHGYSQALRLGHHFCRVTPCFWEHSDRQCSCGRDDYNLAPMNADMHLVVQRYVKPWTIGLDVSFALLMNIGHYSPKRGVPLETLCIAAIFISHCWNEPFKKFATTVQSIVEPDTTVWVCSFALDQNSDILAELTDLTECPFAKALRHARRVIVITDEKAEVFERSWCVLEAQLSFMWDKNYDICLCEQDNIELWERVGRKLETISLQDSKATVEEDKEKILDLVERYLGGIDALNHEVRSVALRACQRVHLMAAAASGEIHTLCGVDQESILSWTSIRGRSITHVASVYGRVQMIMHVQRMTEGMHINQGDDNDRTPLSLAAAHGQYGSALALLALRAEVDKASNTNMTPLHYAVTEGRLEMISYLLSAMASIHAECLYAGTSRTALHIAAHKGQGDVCKLLIQEQGDVDATTAVGTSVLFTATFHGHMEIVAFLIMAKAACDKRNRDAVQRTPLMAAVKEGHVPVVAYLLNVGASPCLEDAAGLSCIKLNEGLKAKHPHTAAAIEQLLKQSTSLIFTARKLLPLLFWRCRCRRRRAQANASAVAPLAFLRAGTATSVVSWTVTTRIRQATGIFGHIRTPTAEDGYDDEDEEAPEPGEEVADIPPPPALPLVAELELVHDRWRV